MNYQPGLVPINPEDLPGHLQEEFEKISAALQLLVDLQEFADDTAAAAGGVEIGNFYRTGSTVKVRAA